MTHHDSVFACFVVFYLGFWHSLSIFKLRIFSRENNDSARFVSAARVVISTVQGRGGLESLGMLLIYLKRFPNQAYPTSRMAILLFSIHLKESLPPPNHLPTPNHPHNASPSWLILTPHAPTPPFLDQPIRPLQKQRPSNLATPIRPLGKQRKC